MKTLTTFADDGDPFSDFRMPEAQRTYLKGLSVQLEPISAAWNSDTMAGRATTYFATELNP
jgi:hypothetical protein